MDTSFSAAYLTAENARLTARIAELEAKVERLREEADPPRCGNCVHWHSDKCDHLEPNEEPCDFYERADRAEKE